MIYKFEEFLEDIQHKALAWNEYAKSKDNINLTCFSEICRSVNFQNSLETMIFEANQFQDVYNDYIKQLYTQFEKNQTLVVPSDVMWFPSQKVLQRTYELAALSIRANQVFIDPVYSCVFY
jgi:hypothetical protein